MTPEYLNELRKWYDRARFRHRTTKDYDCAFDSFGYMLQHIADTEAELARLRRIEAAAAELVKASWSECEIDNTGHSYSSICVTKGTWRKLHDALEAK